LLLLRANKELADMAPVSLDDKKVKELFKQAIVELFDERRDLLYDLFAEAIEDLALGAAIKEGEDGEGASREEVMKILEAAN
jgi:hypothetical protein